MDHNPQAAQMADESMVRNLAAQIEAIWPQERAVLAGLGIPDDARIADIGCGTGEASARLLDLLPRATLVGLDLDPHHLALARARCPADRATFVEGDAFATGLPSAAFDLAVCRHLLQAVPTPERVVAELVRLVRPGGRVHLLAEDYAMIHFPVGRRDPDRFWLDGPVTFGSRTGTDLRSARRMPGVLRRLGLVDLRVDYVIVDTLRVPREVFVRIWEAWRDGYTDALTERTGIPDVRAHWDDMIACLRDPDAYCVWHVPLIGGRLPG